MSSLSSLQLSSLPLRPSTLTLLHQRGFVTLGEWSEAKHAGLATLAAELKLDLVETQRIWKEVQECLAEEEIVGTSTTTSATTKTKNNSTTSTSGTTASELLAALPPTGIISFCRAIDQLFWTGGFPLGSLTEVAGLPGVGKTQLAMQLSVTARLPQSLGGVQGQTIYIDTEGSLVPERIYTMAQALLVHAQGTLYKRYKKTNPNHPASSSSLLSSLSSSLLPKDFSTPEQILEGIHIFRVYDPASLTSTLYSLPHWIETLGNIKLIVVDSIAFPFRSSPTPWQSTQCIVQLAALLNDIASQYQLAVVCVNQMTTTGRSRGTFSSSSSSSSWSSSWVPALGDSWAHAVTTRLILGQESVKGKHRICRLVKSPCLPPGQALFQVTEQGIRDVVPITSTMDVSNDDKGIRRDKENEPIKRQRTK